MTGMKPLEETVDKPADQETPEKHWQKPQMLNTIGHTPEGHLPIELIGVETEKQIIDNAKYKTRDDESLEFLPKKAEEALALAQLKALVAENISPNKGNGFDTESTNQMAHPPIGCIGRYSLRNSPTSGENTQRMIDHQKKDNQRSND